MKRITITILNTILLLNSNVTLASIGNEIREVAEEGSGFFGFILAGLFGYVVGYPLLLFIFVIKYYFIQKKPIIENSKKAASMLLDNFVQNFLLLFVFILPFTLIFPIVVFSSWIENISFISIYAIYTLISLLLTTVWTLRKEVDMNG